ncbi:MAG: myxochelin export transporter MxcK, partial [Pseudomonadota bacterium]
MAALVVIQLVTVVDLTMLLPLGPDLLAPLGVDAARLPLLIVAGALSAALAGLLGGGWLERAPRRRTMVGLLLALAAAGIGAAGAEGFGGVFLARLCAGAAGGQAGALGLVVLSEAVPESRRGRAVGAVMAANGLAAIGGVPLGLWLAQTLGWRAPFGLITLGAVLAALISAWAIPSSAARPAPLGSRFAPVAMPTARRALALGFLVAAASTLLTPNLSAFV